MSGLAITRVTDELIGAMEAFFDALKAAGDEEFFHPHPLDSKNAHRIASYCGKDLYYVVSEGDRILAYGMMRGWDEGFDIPSVGIAVHPMFRRRGIGRRLMNFLHLKAKEKGATKVRLKVYRNNAHAVGMYKKLGYEFCGEAEGQLLAYLDLAKI